MFKKLTLVLVVLFIASIGSIVSAQDDLFYDFTVSDVVCAGDNNAAGFYAVRRYNYNVPTGAIFTQAMWVNGTEYRSSYTVSGGSFNYSHGAFFYIWGSFPFTFEVVWDMTNDGQTIGGYSMTIVCEGPGEPAVFEFNKWGGGSFLVTREHGDPIAIYLHQYGLEFYPVNPLTGDGVSIFFMSYDELEALTPGNENTLIAELTNPFTDQPITVWLLTSGYIQVNTIVVDPYHGDQPHVVAFKIEDGRMVDFQYLPQ